MAAPSSRKPSRDGPRPAPHPAYLPPPASFPRFASSPIPHAHMPSQALATSEAPPNYPLLPTG